jgi:hypothetical protein
MSARALLERLTAEGVTVRLDGEDICLLTAPPRTIDKALVAELRAAKAEVVAELRRESDVAQNAVERGRSDAEPAPVKPIPPNTSALSQRGVMCGVCLRADRCYSYRRDDGNCYVCPGCSEWRVAGCLAFTVLERADEAAEARYGACLSCGGSIELHGSPDASKWRRVASLDDVEIAAIRYVLASASAIAREARR